MVKDSLFVAVSLMITVLVIFLGSVTGCATDTSEGQGIPVAPAGNSETKDIMDDVRMYSEEEEILMLAQRAASSHNSQPWALHLNTEGCYVVTARNERWLSKVDPYKRELLLSLGAYLENIRIAAECFGYHAEIQILMSDVDDTDIARFDLIRQNGERNDERISLMRSSSMAKVKYKKAIKSMDSFSEFLDKQDHTIWIDRSDPVFDYILKATVEANRKQAWNDERQMELADYICFSQDDEDYGVGMTPQMLNLPWFMSRSWYKKAGPESVMAKMFRNGTPMKAEKLMKNCAGVILVTSRDNSVQSLLECGGRFQRLYWECKEQDIEVHTVSQILEESPWKEDLPHETGVSETIQFVLRTGMSKETSSNLDAISSASIRLAPVITLSTPEE